MRIAVNARFLLPHRLEGFGWYTHEIVRRMAAAHPEDEFILFFDRQYDPKFIYGPNVKPVVLFPQSRHPLLWYWWFEYSVPKALHQCKADVFFSPDSYLSLSTPLPTLMTVHDIVPLHHPEGIPWATRQYYQYYLPKFIHRADHILTVSDYVRQDIAQTCNIDKGKISVVYNGARDSFKPFQKIEKQLVRDLFAQQKPYFFYTGAIHPRKNIPRLLRAFDQFKAKTKAPHRLLLAGRLAWKTAEVTETHAAMQYHDDVSFLGYVPETDLPRLMAAATALVYVSLSEGFGLPMLEAMCTDTPVIAANASCLPEIAGDAALLVDPLSEMAIADAMSKLSSDADFAQDLITKARLQREKFDWGLAAAGVYDKLMRL